MVLGGKKWQLKKEDQWRWEMEDHVKVFKHLEVWFDRGMERNVQLEKMKIQRK